MNGLNTRKRIHGHLQNGCIIQHSHLQCRHSLLFCAQFSSIFSQSLLHYGNQKQCRLHRHTDGRPEVCKQWVDRQFRSLIRRDRIGHPAQVAAHFAATQRRSFPHVIVRLVQDLERYGERVSFCGHGAYSVALVHSQLIQPNLYSLISKCCGTCELGP